MTDHPWSLQLTGVVEIADEESYRFPEGSSLYKDTGFQGYESLGKTKDEPKNTTTYQPKKKPKGGELTLEERACNRAISKERIGVEHATGGAKVYRIVRDVFRQHLRGFDDLVIDSRLWPIQVE